MGLENCSFIISMAILGAQLFNNEEEQRHSLASLIERNAVEIELRWLEEVQIQVSTQMNMRATHLRNAISDYLIKLAQSFRADPDSNGAPGIAAWIEVDRAHAVTCGKADFDIQQLVNELIVLRRVLVKFARNEGLLIDSRQAERLTDSIEAAICSAVGSYVNSIHTLSP